jgi:hypothetical protein
VRGESALIDLTLAEGADSTATLHDLKHITDQLLVRNPPIAAPAAVSVRVPTTGSARAARSGDGQAAAELRGALIHAVACDGRAAGWPC